MSVSKDIALLLQHEAYGTLGTDLFYGQIPPTDADNIVVLDESAKPYIYSEIVGSSNKRYSVTVQVQNKSFTVGHNTINTIKSLLWNKNNPLNGVSGVENTIVYSKGEYPIVYDDLVSGRHVFQLYVELFVA